MQKPPQNYLPFTKRKHCLAMPKPKLSIVDKMITADTLLNQYKLKKHRHEQ